MDARQTIHQRRCSVDGCTRKFSAKGFCRLHYVRLKRHGDPLIRGKNDVFKLSFKDLDNVKAHLLTYRNTTANHALLGTPCWEWTRKKDKDGYGKITIDNKACRVTRVSSYLWKGFHLQSAMLICHQCDNPPCFNPEHLFIGTARENVRDSWAKGRSKAKRGENNHAAKLNNFQVQRIRLLFQMGIGNKQVIELFKVSRSIISAIKCNKSWNHVK